MLSAYEVGTVSHSETYPFGISAKRAADELRLLADKIEREEILLQKVYHTSLATHDDYPMTRVSLTYFEKQKKADERA